jgi:hypothetical protein
MNKLLGLMGKKKPAQNHATHDDGPASKPVEQKAERLHRPEMDEGSMQIGKPKKGGRPPKGEKAQANWERQKAYRERKRQAAEK